MITKQTVVNTGRYNIRLIPDFTHNALHWEAFIGNNQPFAIGTTDNGPVKEVISEVKDMAMQSMNFRNR